VFDAAPSYEQTCYSVRACVRQREESATVFMDFIDTALVVLISFCWLVASVSRS